MYEQLHGFKSALCHIEAKSFVNYYMGSSLIQLKSFARSYVDLTIIIKY